MIEVHARNGTITFDGSVVEFFGFGRRDDSLRVHARFIERLDLVDLPAGRTLQVAIWRGQRWQGLADFDEEGELAFLRLAADVEAVRP